MVPLEVILFVILFLTFNLTLSQHCGLENHPKSPSHSRIAGGTIVSPHQFPWMVHFEAEYSFSKSFIRFYESCGGVVLDEQWILSAAHCFVPEIAPGYRMGNVRVKVGVHNLTDGNERSMIVMAAQKVIRHPLYNDSYFDSKYDIALVRLSNPLNLSAPSSRSICLPTPPHVTSVTECRVLGWGKTGETKSSSSVLKSVDVLLYSGADCSKIVHREEVSRDLQVCAGFSGSGPCKGDSGGPLQCRNEVDGSWVLVGITSYSDNCGGSKPAVFTNVQAFVGWIDKVRSDEK